MFGYPERDLCRTRLVDGSIPPLLPTTESSTVPRGADNDCTFLFITNKPFGICYAGDHEHFYPMDGTDS